MCGSAPQDPEPASTADRSATAPSAPETPNKGTLRIDATVADQQIVYPTDLGLINTARQESERMIDLLYDKAKAVEQAAHLPSRGPRGLFGSG